MNDLTRKPEGHHDDHDDFGGLHRDLVATGTKMDRRRVLRMAAGFGANWGAMQLLGCSHGVTDATSPIDGGTNGSGTGSTNTGTIACPQQGSVRN